MNTYKEHLKKKKKNRIKVEGKRRKCHYVCGSVIIIYISCLSFYYYYFIIIIFFVDSFPFSGPLLLPQRICWGTVILNLHIWFKIRFVHRSNGAGCYQSEDETWYLSCSYTNYYHNQFNMFGETSLKKKTSWQKLSCTWNLTCDIFSSILAYPLMLKNIILPYFRFFFFIFQQLGNILCLKINFLA